MKKKRLVAAVVVIAVVIVAVSAIFLYLNRPVRVSLLYEGQLIKIEGSSSAYLSAIFRTDGSVLYNCNATVTYTAANGSPVQITKQLGTVDLNEHNFGTDFELPDYPSDTPLLLEFSNNNPLQTVQIDAYGYTKPIN